MCHGKLVKNTQTNHIQVQDAIFQGATYQISFQRSSQVSDIDTKILKWIYEHHNWTVTEWKELHQALKVIRIQHNKSQSSLLWPLRDCCVNALFWGVFSDTHQGPDINWIRSDLRGTPCLHAIAEKSNCILSILKWTPLMWSFIFSNPLIFYLFIYKPWNQTEVTLHIKLLTCYTSRCPAEHFWCYYCPCHFFCSILVGDASGRISVFTTKDTW